MKKVLTVGVFDILHIGHLLLFERAKQYGDYLIVAVQVDTSIFMHKPYAKMIYNTEERKYMVQSTIFVDEVILYTEIDTLISQVDFDVFVKGEDQNHEGFQIAMDWCKRNNKDVVTLQRTEGISSTTLREYLKD